MAVVSSFVRKLCYSCVSDLARLLGLYVLYLYQRDCFSLCTLLGLVSSGPVLRVSQAVNVRGHAMVRDSGLPTERHRRLSSYV